MNFSNAECYLWRWNIRCRSSLINKFSEGYNSGELAYSHRESIITMMLKTGERTD